MEWNNKINASIDNLCEFERHLRVHSVRCRRTVLPDLAARPWLPQKWEEPGWQDMLFQTCADFSSEVSLLLPVKEIMPFDTSNFCLVTPRAAVVRVPLLREGIK